jgi:hypothetical protein
MYTHLIDEGAIEKIRERGCCLGKYRVLLNSVYYCCMGGVLNCSRQNKEYFKVHSYTNGVMKILDSYMTVCTTNNQLPCQECDLYETEKIKNGYNRDE